MTDLASILSAPVSNAVKPPLTPVGSYQLRIKDYRFDVSDQKKTPYVEFEFAIEAPGPDVDQAALQGINLSERTLRNTFYLSTDAVYRLREFVENALGLQTENMSWQQVLPQTRGLPVIGNVVHVASKKPGSTDIYANINGFARAQ